MEDSQSEKLLTDEDFWENYWANLSLPSVVDPNFSFERSLIRLFRRYMPKESEGLSCLEVGCAPGRWMILFAKEFGCNVVGIEYVPIACQKTRENLALCGVSGEVHERDFRNNGLPDESFDIIVSLGLLEHFDPVQPIIDEHIRLLRKGGYLFLGIPNLNGINRGLQKWFDPEWLDHHNMTIANKGFFAKPPTDYDLETVWSGNTGGFEPSLFHVVFPAKPTSGPAIKQQKLLLARRSRVLSALLLNRLHLMKNRLHGTDNINHPLWSGYWMGVYRRKS